MPCTTCIMEHPWARRSDPMTMLLKELTACAECRTKAIIVNASGRGPQMTAEEAAELERARSGCWRGTS